MQGPPDSPDTDETTVHVRRARDGDADSLAWLVTRFSPWLMVQARYRLGQRLGQVYAPEDLVQDVWLVTLSKLGTLAERDQRHTPVLIRFLATTLNNRVRTLAEKYVSGARQPVSLSALAPTARDASEPLATSITGAITKLARDERKDLLMKELAALDDREREIVILAGLEQQPRRAIGERLGISANAVAVAYARARKKLRERLPADLFEDLADD